MDLSALIHEEAIFCDLRLSSKKQVLKDLAEKASDLTGVDKQVIFDTLLEREKLGSTGLGHGLAIPHGKVEGLQEPFALIATLAEPISFEAVDDKDVDIIVLLLASETNGAEHLKALSKIARIAHTPGMLDKIRTAHSPTAIYAVISSDDEAES